MVSWPVASESNLQVAWLCGILPMQELRAFQMGEKHVAIVTEVRWCQACLFTWSRIGVCWYCFFSVFLNLKSPHVSGRQPAPELACIATGPTFCCFGIATFALHDFIANEWWFNWNYWQRVLTNHKAFARSSTKAHPTKTPQGRVKSLLQGPLHSSAFSVLLYPFQILHRQDVWKFIWCRLSSAGPVIWSPLRCHGRQQGKNDLNNKEPCECIYIYITHCMYFEWLLEQFALINISTNEVWGFMSSQQFFKGVKLTFPKVTQKCLFIQLAEASLEKTNLMLLQPWLLSVEVPKWMKAIGQNRWSMLYCTYVVPMSISVGAINSTRSKMQESRSKEATRPSMPWVSMTQHVTCPYSGQITL